MMPNRNASHSLIVHHREQVQKAVGVGITDPSMVFKKLLENYLTYHPNKPFAYMLVTRLSKQNVDILNEIETYLQQNPNHDEFYAVLVAYFYYYIDYYQVRYQPEKATHPFFCNHILLPLRLLHQKHQAEIINKVQARNLYISFELVKDTILADRERYSPYYATKLIREMTSYTTNINWSLKTLTVAKLSVELLNRLEKKVLFNGVFYSFISNGVQQLLMIAVSDGVIDKTQVMHYVSSGNVYFRFAALSILCEQKVVCTPNLLTQYLDAMQEPHFEFAKIASQLLTTANYLTPELRHSAFNSLIGKLCQENIPPYLKNCILQDLLQVNLSDAFSGRFLFLLTMQPTYEHHPALIRLILARMNLQAAQQAQLFEDIIQNTRFDVSDLQALKHLNLTSAQKLKCIDVLFEVVNGGEYEYQTIDYLCQQDMALREYCMQKIFGLMQGTNLQRIKATNMLVVFTIPAQHVDQVMRTLSAWLQTDNEQLQCVVCQALRHTGLSENYRDQMIDQLLLLASTGSDILKNSAYQACTHFAALIPLQKMNFLQIFSALLVGNNERYHVALEWLKQISLPPKMVSEFITFVIKNFAELRYICDLPELLIKNGIPTAFNQALIQRFCNNLNDRTTTAKNMTYRMLAQMDLSASDINVLVGALTFLANTVLDQPILAFVCDLPLSAANRQQLRECLFNKFSSPDCSQKLIYFTYYNKLCHSLSLEEKAAQMIKLEMMAKQEDEPTILYLVEKFRRTHFDVLQVENIMNQQVATPLPPELWHHTNQFLLR